MLSFFIAASCSFVDLGYSISKILKDIMLQSLPESILYDTTDAACLDAVFKFTDHLLFTVMESM